MTELQVSSRCIHLGAKVGLTIVLVHVDGRQISHPQGKVLGESSVVNFCANVYPSKANFEAWTALGSEG